MSTEAASPDNSASSKGHDAKPPGTERREADQGGAPRPTRGGYSSGTTLASLLGPPPAGPPPGSLSGHVRPAAEELLKLAQQQEERSEISSARTNGQLALVMFRTAGDHQGEALAQLLLGRLAEVSRDPPRA